MCFVFKWPTCRCRSGLPHAPAWNKGGLGGLWSLALGTCSGGREPGLGDDARDKDDQLPGMMV